jgi:AAA domain
MHVFQPLRGADLLAAEIPRVPWNWEGLLAPGSVTLLTGLWKSGKSTLLSLLLARRHRGGVLLDRWVQPGASAVVTEEPEDIWRRRARSLDFGPNVSLYCRPFAGRPYAWLWEKFVEHLVQEQAKHGIDLVAFDPLIAMLPCGENNAASLVDALQPLRQLTERGAAVLLLHHPAKEEAGLGKAARGSGALPAFADIVLELRLGGGNQATRRRHLFGFSRFEETPRRLIAELNPTGTDYTVLGDDDICDDFSANWNTVAAILAAAPRPLMRQEVLVGWPEGRCVPHEATVWRWLRRAADLGLVVVTGGGTKSEPFRFALKATGESAPAAAKGA